MIFSNEWINIPATYLIVAYVSAVVVLTETCPVKSSFRSRLVSYALLVLVYAAALIPNPNAYGLRFFACMSVVWGGMMVCFRYTMCLPWLDAGYTTLRAFLSGDFVASLMWQLVFYWMTRSGSDNKMEATLVMAVPCFLLWLVLIWLIERQFRKEFSEFRIQRKEFVLALLIGILLYFLANISYVLKDSPFSVSALAQTYVLRTFAEFGCVAVLLALHYSFISQRSQLRLLAMENAWQAQAEHFRTYESSVALVNQKYHDLKHQLHLLREEITVGDKLDYVDEMERELDAYEAQHKTGNNALDVILTAKHIECQRNDICLTCVADGALLSYIHLLDLGTLFGNMLDNAIECEKLIPDKEKRLIHISVSRRGAYVQICVRNICETPVTFQEGLPVSTKGDDRYHGIGTASIRSVVEKYQGSVVMQCSNGWFEVNILLPGHD